MAAASIGACDSSPPQPSHDLEALGRFIELPGEPVSAEWETAPLVESSDRVPGPQDWGLVAVLTYEPGEAQKILGTSEALTEGQTPLFSEQLYADWVAEAAGGHFVGATSGWYELVSPARSASAFARSPLLDGFVLPLEGGSRLLVALHTR